MFYSALYMLCDCIHCKGETEWWSLLCLCTKMCVAGYIATKSNRACQGPGQEILPASDRELWQVYTWRSLTESIYHTVEHRFISLLLLHFQVVVMEGMNTTGRKLMASKLYEVHCTARATDNSEEMFSNNSNFLFFPLSFWMIFFRESPYLSTLLRWKCRWKKVGEDKGVHNTRTQLLWTVSCTSSLTTAEPLMVLVACGPYAPSDSLTFDPLLDLINVIVRDRPDVCILVQFLCFFVFSFFKVLPACHMTAHYSPLLCSWAPSWIPNMNKSRYVWQWTCTDSKPRGLLLGSDVLRLKLIWCQYTHDKCLWNLVGWSWTTICINLFLKQKAQVTETFDTIFSRCIESIVDGTKRYVSHLLTMMTMFFCFFFINFLRISKCGASLIKHFAMVSSVQHRLSPGLCALPERHPASFHLPTASLHPAKPQQGPGKTQWS